MCSCRCLTRAKRAARAFPAGEAWCRRAQRTPRASRGGRPVRFPDPASVEAGDGCSGPIVWQSSTESLSYEGIERSRIAPCPSGLSCLGVNERAVRRADDERGNRALVVGVEQPPLGWRRMVHVDDDEAHAILVFRVERHESLGLAIRVPAVCGTKEHHRRPPGLWLRVTEMVAPNGEAVA